MARFLSSKGKLYILMNLEWKNVNDGEFETCDVDVIYNLIPVAMKISKGLWSGELAEVEFISDNWSFKRFGFDTREQAKSYAMGWLGEFLNIEVNSMYDWEPNWGELKAESDNCSYDNLED